MAVAVEARTNSSTGGGVTTHIVAIPDGSTVSGKKLLICAGGSGTGLTTSWPSGWTQIAFGNSGAWIEAREHVIDGTEGYSGTSDTITVTTSGASNSAHRAWRLTGQHASTSEGELSSGTNTTPDPPLVTPTWGSDTNLWVVFHWTNSGSETNSGYPTGFGDTFTAGTVRLIAAAEQTLAAASLNPDTFTKSGAVTWRGLHVAVRPAAGAAATVFDPMGMSGFFGA